MYPCRYHSQEGREASLVCQILLFWVFEDVLVQIVLMLVQRRPGKEYEYGVRATHRNGYSYKAS